MQELVNEICNNPSETAHRIQKYIEIQASELDICPYCLERLEYSPITDSETIEYQGSPTHLKYGELYCPNCGKY